jgi:hypothetical protein
MKGAGHLVRLAVAFLAGTLAFLGLRAYVMPHSFGQYGHYRGDAISEAAALPIMHAGHEACEACHTDVLDEKSKGKHAGVSCEACHGPQAKHADDPDKVTPPKPNPSVLCAQCHEASAAKPKWFPQVASVEHSGGEACISCHSPHDPMKSSSEPETKK